MFITTTLTACNETEDGIPTQASNKLSITVGLNQPQSRAGIITANTLADGSTIGILLDDGAETDYDAVDNIKFTASTQNAKQVWTPESDIVLSDTKGTLYAYYPYVQGTDLSAIPVETASQTDYLYATPVSNVNESNASVAVTMNHMLSNIKVSIARGTYVGDGNITNITIQSDGFATGGTFNAAQATPAFTAVTGTGDEITRTVTATLGGTATDMMVVPTGTSKAVTFIATIDGVDYTVTSSDVELEEGNSYEYTLSLNSTFMSVASVAVTPWNTVPKESLTLEKYNPWKFLDNEVYAVAADGSPVEVANADESCIAVALVVGEHKFWIEKNGESNSTSIQAAYTADGASNTGYQYFYWGPYGTDVSGITNWTGGDGTVIPTDYTTWSTNSTYAWNDFNGKSNTAALLNVTDSDNNTTYANAATYCKKFNETSSENQGYTDWYIPACGQLALIYINVTEINAALTKIGGTTFSASNTFWSSSEYSSDRGWYVSFFSGRVRWNGKNNFTRVRFVRDF